MPKARKPRLNAFQRAVFKIGALDRSISTSSFMAKHGHWVKLGANASMYITGAVVLVKTTSTIGVIAGAGALVVGIVGVSCSAAEIAARQSSVEA